MACGRLVGMGPTLGDGSRAALREADERPLSYRLRFLLDSEGKRLLVVVGEAHVKLGAAHALGRRIVSSFELRGVESFPATVFGGRVLKGMIHGPRWLLTKLSLGFVHGSTITTALELDEGQTVRLERDDDVPRPLHVASVYLIGFHIALVLGILLPLVGTNAWLALLWVPFGLLQMHFMLTIVPAVLLRTQPWSHWINPVVAILGLRDATMARGTLAMLAEHTEPDCVVVLMGRAHLAGYCRRMMAAGYREVEAALVIGDA